MVKKRGCFTQETLPEQLHSESSWKVGTVTRYSKEESVQDET